MDAQSETLLGVVYAAPRAAPSEARPLACAQFASMYSLQEPAALAVMLSTFNGGPLEQYGPPSAELWTAVLVRRRVRLQNVV